MARLSLYIALALVLVAPSAADAKRPKLKVPGAKDRVVACGADHRAVIAGVGERVIARTRKRAKLRTATCVDGRWERARRPQRGRRHRVDTGLDADLRLRSRGRTRYVRVGQGPVSEIPISFSVVNGNRTSVTCPVDNQTYTIRGHLTAPAAALDADAPLASTLYAHGHSFSETLWRYKDVPGYDFVGTLARRGHISITYDRLGYETSDKPNGYASCYGSEATVADQLIQALKAGDYTTDGHPPLAFERVALAGHSQAAIFSNLATSTFKSPDALLHFSFFESGITPALAIKYNQNLAECASSPSPANQDPANPTGYAFRGVTEDDFVQTNFVSAEPAVVEAFTAMRNVDPCGFPNTAVEAVARSNTLAGTIEVPVLVVFGGSDPNFAPAAATFQSAVFSGSSDVTAETISGAGHALMLEAQAAEFQNVVDKWLRQRGF